MKRLAAVFALSALGCQGPSPTLFAGDLVLPAASGLGVRESAITIGDGPNGSHILFLNFDGDQVRPPSNFYDNSATGESQIARQTAALPAFDASPYAPAFTRAAAIGAIAGYFKQFYAPFNVQVVTQRPSGVRYTMCIVGGDPSLLGHPPGTAGIAPLDCGNRNEPDITYAFSASLDPSTTGSATDSLKAIAVTAAQETAHAFGLGHTQDQNDIMYPQLTFTANGFAKGPQALQPDGSGQCSPGASTQDSYQMLGGVIGFSSGVVTGPTPTVMFLTPTEGSTVPLTFDIEVAASESGGSIAHVDVTAPGQSIFSLSAPPYKQTVSAMQEGSFQLTATAYDANGTSSTQTVNFTLKAGAVQAQPDLMPPIPPSADGGTASTAPGAVGAACQDGSQCTSGLCATAGSQKFCTTSCDPANASSCPTELDCVASGPDHYCAPRTSGGCQLSAPGARGTRAASDMLAALCLFIALTLVRRRGRDLFSA